jgi:hypothetical protein
VDVRSAEHIFALFATQQSASVSVIKTPECVLGAAFAALDHGRDMAPDRGRRPPPTSLDQDGEMHAIASLSPS